MKLLFESGTAYDLFWSLHVLHRPEDFQLRAAWAAGVRSRLPEPARGLLARIFEQPVGIMHWVHTLPPPKDGATALATLAAIPPAARNGALFLPPHLNPEAVELLQGVASRGGWDAADERRLQTLVGVKSRSRSARLLTLLLDAWATPVDFGEALLEALSAYYEVFFAEEERRIAPVLAAAEARARALSETLAPPALLEELSEGLRRPLPEGTNELVIIPIFWTTPLVIEESLAGGRHLFLFGARPPEMGLVPGETVPDLLQQALKALAEPTRLRILNLLATEPQGPSRLARRLRLRPPTVVHHLHVLRLARLVMLEMDEEGVSRRYALRPEALDATYAALDRFIGRPPAD